MEFDAQRLLTLILENQKEIANLKVLVKEGVKEIKDMQIWILAGLVGVIPVAIYIHRQLHPVEYFIGEKGKEIDKLLRKVKNIEKLSVKEEQTGETISIGQLDK